MQWIDYATIKQNVGLAGGLRHYRVSLRRSGRDQYRGLCPIHRGEGRDAFHANLSRNIFLCFSCGAGGTVLDFVAAMEDCSLREAARKLANGPSSSAAPVAGPPNGTVTRKSISLSPLGFTPARHRSRAPLSGSARHHHGHCARVWHGLLSRAGET